MSQTPVQPYSYCSGCKKPSWNKQVIKWQLARFKAYYCIDCNPFMNTQTTQKTPETMQNEEEAAYATSPVEPLYHRPESEVQEDFFQTHSIQDVPF